ncbi:MAG: SusD/RagB family nutrient-binding outer membrane lipoprotein [Allomuricauda sp.]
MLSTLGCDDYLDVDTDVDNPTTVALNLVLPNIQLAVGDVGAANLFTGEILSVYTHQLVSRSSQDQYGAAANNTTIRNDWNNIYLALTDIETLISQATESGDRVYLGIGQTLKAYLATVAVDLWGDVPFSEATQLKDGIISPVFDNQQSVYEAAFGLLDQAKVNVSSGEGVIFPGNDDLFYGGDTSKWIKFINTLKLKLYNQVRLSSLFNSSQLNALVAEDNFFSSSADDFQFTHFANITPTDERNELFQVSYGQAQVDHYLSPWFYEILNGWNPNIHTGNADPRIPYYWANQLAPGQFPRDQGDTTTGDPNADYWDSSTGFFTIRFGSIGPDRDHAVQTDATFPGIYPCGGRYDDGLGFGRTINSGTGVAPQRILTYYELLYIQAELIQVGLIAGDASTKLREALVASIAKVDEVVAGSGTTQTVPVLAGTAAANDFIDNVVAEFDAASDEKKLEIIMTQKWVASFGDPLDQYNDYRRTGYPVLADPNGASPEYQLDNGDGFPLNDAFTTLGNNFQLSFFWPEEEISNNSNAPAQKDPTTYKIFWDN